MKVITMENPLKSYDFNLMQLRPLGKNQYLKFCSNTARNVVLILQFCYTSHTISDIITLL